MTDKKKNLTVLQKAVNSYGAASQIDIAIEECSELIQSLCKMKRYYSGALRWNEVMRPTSETKVRYARTYHNVCQEIADVQIMLDQAVCIFDPIRILKWRAIKLDKMQKQLNEFKLVTFFLL